ncbi:MAG: hypothetical protein PHI85_11190 [Victivallaceae bacterium]|nr:hypothetical protein [Victivallaceae bacterium]
MMNDKELNTLLARRTARQPVFSGDEEKFLANFWTEAERVRRFHRITVHRLYAAAALLLAACGVAIALYPSSEPPDDAFRQLSETVRIFGGDVGVVFLGGELATGERLRHDQPENLIRLELRKNGVPCELLIASADNDTVILDSPFTKGEIVVSRCDRDTIVLDIDIRFDDRTEIRTAVPVYSIGGDRYTANGNS